MSRPYEDIAQRLAGRAAGASRDARMQMVVDALWESLADHGVSWVGFYVADDRSGVPDSQRLALGPRRDKPACSPIGLHGVCGQAFTSGETRIVRDVSELGADYIACDPRDRSEIVLPLFEKGRRWGVIDVDSWDLAAFDERDEAGLKGVLRAGGFDPGN